MSWAGRLHPVEVLADWGAPSVLAGAAVWAASSAHLPFLVVVTAGVVALAGGVMAMRLSGRAPSAGNPAFEPVQFDSAREYDELLLDNPLDELLLDDPLVEPQPSSRVVQLFARQDPTPGELVLRISDYLNGPTKAAAPDRFTGEQVQPDASAALHAALANIRASLR